MAHGTKQRFELFLLQKVERDIKNHVKFCAGHKEKIKGWVCNRM